MENTILLWYFYLSYDIDVTHLLKVFATLCFASLITLNLLGFILGMTHNRVKGKQR